MLVLALGSGQCSRSKDDHPVAPEEPPRLSILPPTLDFGSDKSRLSLSLKNVGGGGLEVEVEASVDWISLNTSEALLTAGAVVEVHVQVDRKRALFSDRPVVVITTGGGDTHEVPVQADVAGALTRLTHHDASDGWPSWSPDGGRIAFLSERDGNWEVYVMDADGHNPGRLTQHDASDGWPSWSAGTVAASPSPPGATATGRCM